MKDPIWTHESRPMPDTKDIADLLEEVQNIVHGLRNEKNDLLDQVNRLELELSRVKEAKAKEVQQLEDTNAHLTQTLQETKAQLSKELQETQIKLDRYHPELQSLQDELQNSELQINLLQIDLAKKNEEIQALESKLQAFTSLALASVPAEESKA